MVRHDKVRKRWIVAVDLGRDPATGKRRRRWRTALDRESAKRIERELLQNRDAGAVIPSSRMTLAQFIDDIFLPGYCAVKVRARTLQGYESIIRAHIRPALGHIRLVDLTTDKSDKFYAGMLANGLSKRSVLHVHRLLHSILEQARRYKYIIANPVKDATLPTPDKAEIVAFEYDEVERFLQAAKNSRYYTLYLAALHTGMRRSELCGLKWSDVDLVTGVIAVRRVLYRIRGKGLVEAEPKTAKSNRLVPITAPLMKILSDHRAWLNFRMLNGLKRSVSDHDYVFPNSNLGPQDPDRVTRDFHRIVVENGLGRTTFHGLRHTFATLAKESGMATKDISDVLGHSTIATTADIYQHSKVWLQKEAMEKFSLKLNEGGKE